MKILGHEYTVEYDDNLSARASAVGMCNPNKLEFLIDPTAPKSRQEEAMGHEVIEAINYHAELDLSHQTISLLGECLYQVFVDNGGLPKCLTEKGFK
jgi:hypothetical protein